MSFGVFICISQQPTYIQGDPNDAFCPIQFKNTVFEKPIHVLYAEFALEASQSDSLCSIKTLFWCILVLPEYTRAWSFQQITSARIYSGVSLKWFMKLFLNVMKMRYSFLHDVTQISWKIQQKNIVLLQPNNFIVPVHLESPRIKTSL